MGTARPADIAAGVVEAVGELDGVFAGFAFNPSTTQCTLLTDRFGLVPLYVHEQDDTLCFSTSLALLLALRQPVCQIDPVSVSEMLTLQMILGNRTFLREVRLVEPATALHLSTGPPSPAVYWNWKGLAPAANPGRDGGLDLVHETYALIEQAVLRGVPSGAAKVAVPLSGGLDSRLLLAVLTRNDVPVQAYNIDFGREAGIAREVARTLATPLHSLPMWDQPHTVPVAHEAVDCGCHVNQVWGWEMARRAAEEDGCTVLFDGLAFDTILGAELRASGASAPELARGLESIYIDIDEDSLARTVGESAGR